MGCSRHLLLDSSVSGFYHCVSRCVRRAVLCGDAFEHRRAWIENRLIELLDVFAVRFCAYGIVSNHLHLVLEIEPASIRSLTNLGPPWATQPADAASAA